MTIHDLSFKKKKVGFVAEVILRENIEPYEITYGRATKPMKMIGLWVMKDGSFSMASDRDIYYLNETVILNNELLRTGRSDGLIGTVGKGIVRITVQDKELCPLRYIECDEEIAKDIISGRLHI